MSVKKEYPPEFVEMVDKACRQNSNIFLGYGNPCAQILVIGKELGFDPQSSTEIQRVEQNVIQWQKQINGMSPDFNPQTYGWGSKCFSSGHTWNKYAELHGMLFGNHRFFENFFFTELNDNPSAYSGMQNKSDRKKSIIQRLEFMRTTAFFQRFPVVIMANGNYPFLSGNKSAIEDTFNVLWDEKVCRLSKQQWYSIHRSPDCKRIVIHTRQLSMAVSNILLSSIANQIRTHLMLPDVEIVF